MKKIPSLFKRNYDTDYLVRDEIVPGSEWVIAGKGIATVKYDGEACMVKDGELFTRYNRRLTKRYKRMKSRNPDYVPILEHFKIAPIGWIPCEPSPDLHTGHWPGWSPVCDGPEHKAHREALGNTLFVKDGTYELVGPKIQGNKYKLGRHELWHHGGRFVIEPPRTYNDLREWLAAREDIEGLVWHHHDGRMCKIKRRDFGLDWPVK